MSTDRDTTRIVRSWLEEGATALPDRVLDAVLDQVPATPQRRSWWPPRRSISMNTQVRLAIAAAAVLLVAVVGYQVLPRNGNVGGPPTAAPSPSASAVPSATPTPSPVPFSLTPATGLLVPGRIVLDGPFPASVTFEVPQGWSRQGTTELADYVAVHKVRGSTAPLWLEWATIQNVYADPCHPAAGQIDPPVGPSVDDLVTALTSMVGFSATAVTDVSVDGHAGKHFQLSDTIDPAAAGCDDSTWLSLWEPAAGGDTAKVPGPATMQFWIVDVDGTRVVIFTEQYGPTSNDMAELTRIVESIHIG